MEDEILWPIPPVGGYRAEDLDTIPGLPSHIELIDGSLVFAAPRNVLRMRDFNPEDVLLVVYAYELDPATRQYVPTGVHRDRVTASWPFPIDLDLTEIALPEQ